MTALATSSDDLQNLRQLETQGKPRDGETSFCVVCADGAFLLLAAESHMRETQARDIGNDSGSKEVA